MKRTRILMCYVLLGLSQFGVSASGQVPPSPEQTPTAVALTLDLSQVNFGALIPHREPAGAARAVWDKSESDWRRMSPEDQTDNKQLDDIARDCAFHRYDPEPYLKGLFPFVKFKWWIIPLPYKFNPWYPASVKALLERYKGYKQAAPFVHSMLEYAWQQFPRQLTFNIPQDQIRRLASAVDNHNGSGDQQSRVQTLEQKVSELEESEQEKNETIAKLQSQLADSLKQQQELQKSFETSQKQNQELRALFVAFQKQHAEEVSKLQSQINAHEQRITTIQQCLTGFTNVSESTNQLMAVANEMKLSNDNTGEITKLHQQIEELSKKFAEVQQTLPQSALDDVNVRLRTLSANVDVLTTFIKPDQLPDGWIQKNGIAKMLRTLIPMIKSIDQVLKNSDHVSAYKEAFEVQLQRLNSNAK